MEFYPLGSLQPCIHGKQSNQVVQLFAYSKRQVLSLPHDCVAAFQELDEKQLIHCDIKPANVLLKVSDTGKLKAIITDFDVARLMNSRQNMVQAFKESRLNGLSLQYEAPDSVTRLRSSSTTREMNPQV